MLVQNQNGLRTLYSSFVTLETTIKKFYSNLLLNIRRYYQMIKMDLFGQIISSVAVFKVKSEQLDTGVAGAVFAPLSFMIVQLL